MSDYQQDLMRMRLERKQAEALDQYEQARNRFNQAEEERHRAYQEMGVNGDRTEFDYWDAEQEEAWREVQPFVQAQQPRVDPRLADWARRHPAFFERHGQRAVAAVDDALGYIYRPRNDSTNNPALRGMGMDPRQGFTPDVEQKLNDVLEMHASAYHGIKFDPKEVSLTANEVAGPMTGIGAQEYNRNSQAAAALGKFSKG